jgi:hypothetical protein
MLEEGFDDEYLYYNAAATKSTDALLTFSESATTGIYSTGKSYLTDLMVDGNKIKHIMIRKDSTMYTLEFDEIGRLIIKMENLK